MSHKFTAATTSTSDRGPDRSAAAHAASHGRPRNAVAEKQPRHPARDGEENEADAARADAATTRDVSREAPELTASPVPQTTAAAVVSPPPTQGDEGTADADVVADGGTNGAKVMPLSADAAAVEVATPQGQTSAPVTAGAAGVGAAAGSAAPASAEPATVASPLQTATALPPLATAAQLADPQTSDATPATASDAPSGDVAGSSADTAALASAQAPISPDRAASALAAIAAPPTATDAASVVGEGKSVDFTSPATPATTQATPDAATAAALATAAAAPTAPAHQPAVLQPDTAVIAVAVAPQPHAASPVATAQAAPVHTPPAVTAQLVAAVGPLKLAADGVQTLTMMLHPADLGSVQVRAELRDGVVSLQLIGSTDIGREALRAALPDLRRDLLNAGVTTGSLELGTGSPDTGAFSRNTPEGRDPARQDPFSGMRDAVHATSRIVATLPEHSSRGSRGLDVSI